MLALSMRKMWTEIRGVFALILPLSLFLSVTTSFTAGVFLMKDGVTSISASTYSCSPVVSVWAALLNSFDVVHKKIR